MKNSLWTLTTILTLLKIYFINLYFYKKLLKTFLASTAPLLLKQTPEPITDCIIDTCLLRKTKGKREVSEDCLHLLSPFHSQSSLSILINQCHDS